MPMVEGAAPRRLINPACRHDTLEQSPSFRGHACTQCGQPVRLDIHNIQFRAIRTFKERLRIGLI